MPSYSEAASSCSSGDGGDGDGPEPRAQGQAMASHIQAPTHTRRGVRAPAMYQVMIDHAVDLHG